MIDVTIKNYRCFPMSRPARLSIRPGLTAFLGVNNSGKSSLLRLFYELRNLFGFLSTPNGNFVSALGGQPQGFGPIGLMDSLEIFPRSNSLDTELSIRVPGSVSLNFGPIEVTVVLHRNGVNWTARLDAPQFPPGKLTFSGSTGMLLYLDGQPWVDFSPFFASASLLNRAMYLPAFRNAINAGTKADYYDISVGQAFVEVWRDWKTGPNIQQNEVTQALMQDIAEIFGFKSFDVNSSPDAQTLQVFINRQSFRLHELGGGLAQFIMVFANVAIRKPSFILLDEPELNLHPSLQLKFLARLSKYATQGVLFSTHSLALARSSADQIYSFSKHAEGDTEVSPFDVTPKVSAFLDDLSYAGFRELAFDTVLLVEGPTDLPAIRHFLRILQKDHRVVAISLGGNALINVARVSEIEEIKRISSRVAAIVDSERSSEGALVSANRLAFQDACRNAKVPCCILKRRALENYFTDDAIKLVKGPKYRALGPYERFKDIGLQWSKDDNWQVALAMSKADILETDMGMFLDSL